MAALVIFISLDISVESVGSSFPRVILIGSISVEVSVAPEVEAAAVASPSGVLELDTHSSSEVDPSESSPPPVSVAPMVLPFLRLDDSESDTEMPEKHVSPAHHDAMLNRWRSRVASRSSSHTTSTSKILIAPIIPAPSTVDIPIGRLYRTHLGGPCRILTVRKSVRTLHSHRLALRYTSHHLDHFTSGTSLGHSSSDHSSSGHSISGHSLSKHASPNDELFLFDLGRTFPLVDFTVLILVGHVKDKQEKDKIRTKPDKKGSVEEPGNIKKDGSPFCETPAMEMEATVRMRIIDGTLPDNIYGSVKASKPKTLDETIELANDLMDQKLYTYVERQSNNKRKADESFRNNHGHQQQTPKRQNVARVYNMGTGEKKSYNGNLPKSSGNANVTNAQRNNGANPKGNGCFKCEAIGHFKRDCPKLKNKDGEKVNAPG
nr:hypothetical protein [Tanacetum cinerariifolium]